MKTECSSGEQNGGAGDAEREVESEGVRETDFGLVATSLFHVERKRS